jgi:hypothetical protein
VRIFQTKTLRPLFHNTRNRIEIIKKLPKKFHKDNKGIFIIEDVNWLKAWDRFDHSIRDTLTTLAPQVTLQDQQASKLAFYFYHIGLFFQHFGTNAMDVQYVKDVEQFFLAHQAEVGEKEEEQLFVNAFKN